MKGFGYSREKQLIAKAIETRNREVVTKIVPEIRQRLSDRQIAGLFFEVASTLPAGDRLWVLGSLLPKDTWADSLPEILTGLYDFFSERGLKAGRDFGKNPEGEGVWVNRAASEPMLAELPDSLREVFEALMKGNLLLIQDESPVEALEKELGVPFAENLVRRIEQRLPTLTDGQAATYLNSIFEGVEKRTGICIGDFLWEEMPQDKRLLKIFKLQRQGKSEPNIDWIRDLICAAGGESEIRPHPEKPHKHILSLRAIELFDRVCKAKESLRSVMARKAVENPPQPQE
ncbi:hypothetical protein [Kamptonema formosum]|uniref:hypothetical protein n=1 Tax=Kamptonema formosum TaxID=331992 RepID=UPI0003479F44|nr:hypothetical protein [Oscillatoria sp. PCC 10802]